MVISKVESKLGRVTVARDDMVGLRDSHVVCALSNHMNCLVFRMLVIGAASCA